MVSFLPRCLYGSTDAVGSCIGKLKLVIPGSYYMTFVSFKMVGMRFSKCCLHLAKRGRRWQAEHRPVLSCHHSWSDGARLNWIWQRASRTWDTELELTKASETDSDPSGNRGSSTGAIRTGTMTLGRTKTWQAGMGEACSGRETSLTSEAVKSICRAGIFPYLPRWI